MLKAYFIVPGETGCGKFCFLFNAFKALFNFVYNRRLRAVYWKCAFVRFELIIAKRYIDIKDSY